MLLVQILLQITQQAVQEDEFVSAGLSGNKACSSSPHCHSPSGWLNNQVCAASDIAHTAARAKYAMLPNTRENESTLHCCGSEKK